MTRWLSPACGLALVALHVAVAQAQQVTLAAQAQTNAAVFREQVGRHITFVCPAHVNINQDIYGTDVYTDTSPVCTAAAHAGLFTRGTSTAVTIVMGGEVQEFTASTRNAVTSLAYGPWRGTYTFVRSGQPGQIDWHTTIVTVAPDYLAPITLVCPPAGGSDRGEIWGTDVYPDDSAICVAAVHAGVISLAGGAVTVTRVARQASFPSTTRNNITSRLWSDPAWRSYPQPYNVAAAIVPATAVSAAPPGSNPAVQTGAVPTGAIPAGTTRTAATETATQTSTTTEPVTAVLATAPVTGTITPTAAPGATATPAPTGATPTEAAPTIRTAATLAPLLVGAGISDITGPVAEVGMMGYGESDQQAFGLHMRLYARAFVFTNPNGSKRVVFVSAELGQLFSSIKQGVIRELGRRYGTLYSDANVMIAATHTHAGPGGYSHHAMYNLTTFGHIAQNYAAIVSGITDAIVQAHDRLAPATAFLAAGDMADLASVNRSLEAFQLNPEVKAPNPPPQIDPEMMVLSVQQNGTPVGAISWFSVHNTSLTKTNRLVSSDHKGWASFLLERQYGTIAPLRQPGRFVAAFPNGTEGDQSPNLVDCRPLRESEPRCADSSFVLIGPGVDEFDSNRIIGEREFATAHRLMTGSNQQALLGDVDFRHVFVDMPGFAVTSTTNRNGAGGNTLCSAAYGVSFMAGAEDGPTGSMSEGMALGSTMSLANLTAARKIVTGIMAALGALVPPFLPIVAPAIVAIEGLNNSSADECQLPKPVLIPSGALAWTPSILPFQLLRIGPVAIAGIPGEMTVQAGRRLKARLQTALAPLGVQRVILTGLANEYSGYIATPEEYDSQQYEGASTLFGRLTFDAYAQVFGQLGDAMAAGQAVAAGPTPPDLGARQIELQTGVVLDDAPPGETFGQVLQQPPLTVNRNDMFQVNFRAGHPKNDLRTNDTYVRIERNTGPETWELVAWDSMPETQFFWTRAPGCTALCTASVVSVRWRVPLDAQPGTYRIVHDGKYKNGLSGELVPYRGITNSFAVR